MFVPLQFNDFLCTTWVYYLAPSGLNICRMSFFLFSCAFPFYTWLFTNLEIQFVDSSALAWFSQVSSGFIANIIINLIGKSDFLLTGSLVQTLVSLSFHPPNYKSQSLVLQFEPFTHHIVLLIFCKHIFSPIVPINPRIYEHRFCLGTCIKL